MSRKTIGLLILAVFISGACFNAGINSNQSSPTGQVIGVLEGRVTIGPLTPVEIQGRPTPTPAPEVYADRKILIFAEDGRTEISQVSIEPDGSYRIELPVGMYVVDINHLGIDRAAGLPQTVQIVSQQATQLDIDIDTGIR